MSEPSSSTCRCGNLKATGQVLPAGVYPHIPTSERTRLVQCPSLFTADQHSIEVGTFAQITVKPHSHTCVDLFCTGCRTSFRFFAGQGAVYFSVLPESRRRGAGTQAVINPYASNVLPKLFPPFLVPLLQRQNPTTANAHFSDPSESGGVEDPDFDLMFSSRLDPVVGSYRPQQGALNALEFDSPVFGEYSPRSYCPAPKFSKV
jgi:hypothetical protein